MPRVPVLCHHSALRTMFEKTSMFPKRSDLWTEISKIVMTGKTMAVATEEKVKSSH